MERTLLGLFLYDSDRRLIPNDSERRLILNDGDPLRFDGLFEGEAFKGFFHLDPTLFNLLRFFQLSVFRHSLLTHRYLHQSPKNSCAADRKRGYPFSDNPLLLIGCGDRI